MYKRQGHDEFFFGNAVLQAVVRDDGLGAIHELDAYRLRHNFGDTLARRPEHYYRKIRDHRAAQGGHHGEGIASAHDRVNFRHPVAPEDLEPDPVPRVLFIDRRNGHPMRYGRPSVTAARAAFLSKGIRKSMSIEANRLSIEYEFDGEPAPLETEINLAMPSCDGFLGRYVVDGKVPGGFGEAYTWEGIDNLRLEDGVLGGRVVLTCGAPATISAVAHRTVSQSEDGFEKIMQAVTLKVTIPAAANTAFSLTLTVEPLAD